jgi:phage replication-related protein YjqB (UPF0714/DUF867 family)
VSDKYKNFSQLAKAEIKGKDYWIKTRLIECPILIMAPHGGNIEPHTSEGKNTELHITSHQFDEPTALEASSKAQLVVTVHGHRARRDPFVVVGGLHDRLSERIKCVLSALGFTIKPSSSRIAARNSANICNRGILRMGVQLELSRALRNTMCDDTVMRRLFVQAIRTSLMERID